MNITENSGASGVVIATEIQEFIHQLSSDMAKDERQVQRDSRVAELRNGLEAARRMHEKATLVETGAIVGGVITAAAGAGQLGESTEFCTSVADAPHPDLGSGSVKELDAINGKAGSVVQGLGTLASSGGLISQGFNAAGDAEEAASREADALGRAAGERANEADTNLQAITKVDDAAMDLLKDIAHEQHSSVMTVLARQ